MKNLSEFKKSKLISSQLSTLFGGKDIYTTMMGEECSDTWSDNDNDGKFSTGDTICFEECVE